MNAADPIKIDGIGFNIIRELQNNARATFSDIGRKVGLSPPAVAERVYKMEASGIIRGYHADVNPEVFGHQVLALISLTTRPERYPEIHAFAGQEKQVIECHHVSGQESFIFKAGSTSISHLDRLVEKLGNFGETRTTIVLSSPVEKKSAERL